MGLCIVLYSGVSTYVGLYGLKFGPTLTSRPCLHTFWVLTSVHLLPFLLKMFFIILVIIYAECYTACRERTGSSTIYSDT